MRSQGLAGLFKYVCALSQNRSTNKICLFSFENIITQQSLDLITEYLKYYQI